MRPKHILSICAALITLQSAIIPAACASSVSLALEDPYTASEFAPGAQQDFWQAVNSNSDISGIIPYLTDIQIGSDFLKYGSNSDIQSFMNWVGSNGLGLELQTGVLPVTGPNSCGWGVEGYDGMFQNHLQRIHDLGGTLSVLNLDEPLFFGSQWTGPNACHELISTLAKETASAINIAKSIFPNIKVIDTEPVPYVGEYASWLSDIKSFAPGSINEFDADIIWGANWTNILGSDYAAADQYGIVTGAIIDSANPDASNCAWTNSAEANAQSLSVNGLAPQKYLVQSWDSSPGEIGPPNQSCTLSSVALDLIDKSPSPVPEPPQIFVIISMLVGLIWARHAARPWTFRCRVFRGIFLADRYDNRLL